MSFTHNKWEWTDQEWYSMKIGQELYCVEGKIQCTQKSRFVDDMTELIRTKTGEVYKFAGYRTESFGKDKITDPTIIVSGVMVIVYKSEFIPIHAMVVEKLLQ